MAFSKTLVVENQDIYVFQYKATKSGKIAKFWRQILQRMPSTLKNEVRTKPTYLYLTSELKQIYQFYTEGASIELKEHLKGFKVKVDIINSLNDSYEETTK